MPRSFLINGFRFSGIAAGIKVTGVPDLALIVSDRPAVAVGVFTTNRVKAAPVVVSQRNIRGGIARAIVINSGNANACSGRRGLRDAQKMVERTARLLGVPARQVLVCSTGKIGVPLPIEKILQKLPEAVRQLSPTKLLRSARAILTTDNSVKVASWQGTAGGRSYRLIGFAKGAGMIEPHMATMLAFFVTDLKIDRRTAAAIFKRAVDQTFNRITVDSDTSTNDTAILLANGFGNHSLTASGRRQFEAGLVQVMEKLAHQMVADGEGASKIIKIIVNGARNDDDARKVAYAIANSPLVKTAFFGEDPNWGRIAAAAGRSGATLNPNRVDIYYDGVCVARGGVSTGRAQERKAKKVIKKQQVSVEINLHLGRGTCQVLASDLTLDYVKLNSDYRT